MCQHGAAMNGPQDIGGLKVAGHVHVERDEPLFHEPWERNVFGASCGAIIKGLFSTDKFRSGIEQMHPVAYMVTSYYEKWLFTLEYNLLKAGVIAEEELEQRLREVAEDPAAPLPDREDQELLETINWLIPNSSAPHFEMENPPCFAIGESVRGRTIVADPHTRIPTYAMGKTGVIELVHDAFVLPDANVRDEEQAEYVYAVRFGARSLWPDADEGVSVLVDLWESYLEPSGEGESP